MLTENSYGESEESSYLFQVPLDAATKPPGTAKTLVHQNLRTAYSPVKVKPTTPPALLSEQFSHFATLTPTLPAFQLETAYVFKKEYPKPYRWDLTFSASFPQWLSSLYTVVQVRFFLEVPPEEISELELDSPETWTLSLDVSKTFSKYSPPYIKYFEDEEGFNHRWLVQIAGQVLSRLVPPRIDVKFGSRQLEHGNLSIMASADWRAQALYFHPAPALRPESPFELLSSSDVEA